MNNPDHISESLETIFWVKMLNFFDGDPGSGMENTDLGWEKFGSATVFFFIFLGGDLFLFFSYYIQHCFICRSSDSTVATDAGIEPRTVAAGALGVRHSNH
jgi:hypothetical protein